MTDKDLYLLRKVAEASKEHTTLKLGELITALNNASMELNAKSIKINDITIEEVIANLIDIKLGDELDTKVAEKVAEEVSKQSKEIYVVDTAEDLLKLTAQEDKLYIVKSTNMMYSGVDGKFKSLGMYLTPTDELESLKEENLLVVNGGNSTQLL